MIKMFKIALLDTVKDWYGVGNLVEEKANTLPKWWWKMFNNMLSKI